MFCFINPNADEIILENCTCFVNVRNYPNHPNYPNNVYRVMKHSDSNYIWIQSLLYSASSSTKAELVIYDMNELSEPFFREDTETKLRTKDIRNYVFIGNYLVTKEFDKISFVIFHIKEKKVISSNFAKNLFDEICLKNF